MRAQEREPTVVAAAWAQEVARASARAAQKDRSEVRFALFMVLVTS